MEHQNRSKEGGGEILILGPDCEVVGWLGALATGPWGDGHGGKGKLLLCLVLGPF